MNDFGFGCPDNFHWMNLDFECKYLDEKKRYLKFHVKAPFPELHTA
jgi:hypothetical protein